MQVVLLMLGLAFAASQSAIPDSLVQRATTVKERHEKALFRLPAVVGVGVGAAAGDPRRAAIHVLVSRKLKEKERRRFPKQLDGVPVEILESGPVVALPEKATRK